MDKRNGMNKDMNRGKVQQVLGNYELPKIAASKVYVEKWKGIKEEMWVGVRLLKALNVRVELCFVQAIQTI